MPSGFDSTIHKVSCAAGRAVAAYEHFNYFLKTDDDATLCLELFGNGLELEHR